MLGRPRRLRFLQVDEMAFNKSSVDPKLGTELTRLYENYQLTSPDAMDSAEEPTVMVDVSFSSDIDSVSAEQILRAAGVRVDFIECFAHMCSVRIPVSSLKNLSSIDSVKVVHTTHSITNAGSVKSEGDFAMYANVARDVYGKDGTGILIGVLSNSFDCLDGADADFISGDLPNEVGSVVILADLTRRQCNREISAGRPVDEGRAMMQIIHDVAPGARLAFRTATCGQACFALGILQLATLGCDIIVDDISFTKEPMFQDGIIAQAVDQVVAQGIPYFSAAGNNGRNSWESVFSPVNVGAEGVYYHQFNLNNDDDGAPTTRMRIVLPPASIAKLVLQWDQPFYSVTKTIGSASDFDIYLYFNDNLVDSSVGDNLDKDPVEEITFQPSAWSSRRRIPFEVEIVYIGDAPPPTYMKLVVFVDGTARFQFPTVSGALFGHANSAYGAGVGAALYSSSPAFVVSNTPQIETDSSAGGTPILIAIDGTPLPLPQIRRQPRFTGPDGVVTTFFGDLSNRFFGTSAAAAHVAAVAALMLDLKGGPRSLTPAVIYSTLETNAIDMDDPLTRGFDLGFDFGTGYGFVDAYASLSALDVYSDFTLVDVNGAISLGALSDIDYSTIASSSNVLNIEASFPSNEVQSVHFTFDGLSFPCRNSAPFRVFDGIGRKIRLNNHVVTAKPYYDSDCQGTPGLTRQQSFNVAGCSLRLFERNALRRNSNTEVENNRIFQNIRCAANFEVQVTCGYGDESENTVVRMILKNTRTNAVLKDQTDDSFPYLLHPQVNGQGRSFRGRYPPGSYSLRPIIDGIPHTPFTFTLRGNCV